jgi:predicted AlkP superfamily phosphohydrolase/phosphomutase
MPTAPVRKVIALGLDGLEPKIVAAMLARGELPSLGRLKDLGGFARVATTTPAETPVAWSTFATGTNPGGHGIFDFLRRDPATYLPDLSLNRYERKNIFLPPRAVNLRGGVPLWSVLSDAGVPSVVLRCPCTYPPDELRGRMLSGMGTPDLRGGLGTPTFYTTDPAVRPGESERVVTIAVESNTVRTHVIGPRDPKTRADLTAPLTVRLDVAGGRASARVEGSDAECALPLGRWSEWLPVKFDVGRFQNVRGVVRLHLGALEPTPQFYASAVHFDPSEPLFRISTPAGYARELAAAIGPYATGGMVEDHTGRNNGRLSEEAFLEHCELAWREREAMMLHELGRFDEGFFFCLFDTPDRVQHMFWKDREPDHPGHLGRPAGPDRGIIEEHYRRADAMVARALESADEQTLVIALSDHGFGSFRRGINLNSWLHANGLLHLKPGVRPGDEATDMLRGVDWARTKAYAIGLSGVFLNLRGREGQGIVDRAEAPALSAAIARGLRDLIDPATGQAPVRRLSLREEVYSGPFVNEAPDLLVHCGAGYRISWSSSLGGVAADVLEDNVKPWSGDHIVDPSLVPGVLFMNRPFRAESPHLANLAPTILHALGVPRGPNMEGETLL